MKKFFLIGVVSIAISATSQCAPESSAAVPHKQVADGQAAEDQRVRELRALIKERDKFAREGKTQDWQMCDAEIRRHPAPPEDSRNFAKRLIGKWRSPRRDYLYRADGSWITLPAGQDGTRGVWRLEGNQLEETSSGDATKSRYTILLLTDKEMVFTDGDSVFYRTRLTR